MKVLLNRGWYAPNGVYYYKQVSERFPVEMPDVLKDKLPKDAVVIPSDYVVPPPPPNGPSTFKSLADYDVELAASKATAEIYEKANKTLTLKKG